jgi:outer membrane protein OmpA-like peptidoglycan-associated protein
MPKRTEKQSEHHKTSTREQQATLKPEQPDIKPADFLQAFAQENENRGNQGNGLLHDPRLQADNASDLRIQTMQVLHQYGGNAQVQRIMQHGSLPYSEPSLIQREDSESFPVLSWLDRQRHNLMEATGLESSQEAERGRATAFYAHGTYGPQAVRGAGGRGGFNVTYDPVTGVERITIKGGVKFIDGLSVSGGTVTPQNSGLQGAANQAQALTGADRAAFIAAYQWTPAQKAPFVQNLTNVVRDTWGSSATGFSFFINKPQWEFISAHVVIDTQLRMMDEGDNREDDDHLVIDAIREPPGMSETGAKVTYWNTAAHARDPGSAFDQTMRLASSDVEPNTTNMLAQHNTVYFPHGNAVLAPDQQQTLDSWLANYQFAPGVAGSVQPQISIQGYTSASGSEESNLDLGLQRTDAVRNYLLNHGFTNTVSNVIEISHGEAGANPAATAAEQDLERRVEITIGTGQAQVVAAHEFGHAFGLGDEYTTGAAPAGTRAGHDQLVKNMTDESGANLPGAIREDSDSIMSVGNVVRPQHYSTFHNALVQVTGVSEWSIRS